MAGLNVLVDAEHLPDGIGATLQDDGYVLGPGGSDLATCTTIATLIIAGDPQPHVPGADRPRPWLHPLRAGRPLLHLGRYTITIDPDGIPQINPTPRAPP